MNLSKYYKYILLSCVSLCIGFLQWQNHLYASDIEKYEPLTDKVLVNNSFRNKIFSYTGTIEKTFKNKYGIITIYFTNQSFTSKVTASIFPNLGNINEDLLKIGNKITIYGTIKQYKNTYQIAPLDKQSVILVSSANFCSNPTKSSDVSKNMDKTINLAKIFIIDKGEFTSKKGDTHLKVKLRTDDNMVFEGIVWKQNYTKEVKEILTDDKKILCVNAKVGQYKGNISLNINGISIYK